MAKSIIGELIESKQVEWKIPDFFSFSATTGSSYTSPNFNFENTTLHLLFYPMGHETARSGFLSLYVKNETDSPCHVSTTLQIKKTDGTFVGGGSSNVNNIPSIGIGYRNFYDRSLLLQNKTELVPSGTLTIICKLESIQDEKTDITAEKEGDVNKQQELVTVDQEELERLDVLSEDLKQFFANKDTCDIVLQVKDKEYKAHKAILMARSSVFAAMFQHDTLEKQKGFVNIPDCDPDSFQEFLEYLYSGKLSGVSVSNAIHLYDTSKKYEVLEIVEYCVEYLMKNLTVDIFCDVFTFADKYDETKLLSASQDFFNENVGQIVVTTGWESLMRNDYRLAHKILIEMCKAKGSK